VGQAGASVGDDHGSGGGGGAVDEGGKVDVGRVDDAWLLGEGKEEEERYRHGVKFSGKAGRLKGAAAG
jgi:hypothetical protein